MFKFLTYVFCWVFRLFDLFVELRKSILNLRPKQEEYLNASISWSLIMGINIMFLTLYGGISLEYGQSQAMLRRFSFTDTRGCSLNNVDVTFSNSPIRISELMRIRSGRFVFLLKVPCRPILAPSSRRSPPNWFGTSL